MKGKANPFANLLTKLATKPSSAQNENDENEGDATSQSDADEEDKDKVSQTTDGDESDKHEQEIESTTTEDDEDACRTKQNSKQSLGGNITTENEQKPFSLRKQLDIRNETNLQGLKTKSNLPLKGCNKKNNGRQSMPPQDNLEDMTTEHSSEHNVSSDFEDS